MIRTASTLLENLKTLAYLLPQLGRALVTRPETVRFPFAPPVIPKGYRGRVEIHPEKCHGCGLCVRDCPAFALELQREELNTFKLIYYPERCAYCGQCEVSCTFGAIYQTNEFVHGTDDLAQLVVTLVDRKPA
ncbi:MAG: 4Fe-4S binding protein [Anaerolineae bacterium]|nr:4Fe-4S binding protein [Anaerolineae bacterium]